MGLCTANTILPTTKHEAIEPPTIAIITRYFVVTVA
jgi:hypothetical protein